MPNYNSKYIFNFIAQLLHPNVEIDTSIFPVSDVFWDRLVMIGSNQLVLPAIYGAIKRKNLEQYTPTDFLFYIHEISDLNKKRNIEILKQIDYISKIFNNNNIEHVFLKGAALLIKKPYNTLDERMLGDIDVLVSDRDLHKAQNLLINKGFKSINKDFDFTEDLNSARHLKRISHPNFIAAVEIHRKLIDLTLKKIISPEEVLKDKLKNTDGYYIPSNEHLWMHTILNWYYNDSGIYHNLITFRCIIDVLYLESKDLIPGFGTTPKSIKHFYSLLSYYYNFYPTFYKYKKTLFKYQITYKSINKLNNFIFKFIYLINIGFIRLRYKVYRKRVINNPLLVVKRIFNFWKKNINKKAN